MSDPTEEQSSTSPTVSNNDEHPVVSSDSDAPNGDHPHQSIDDGRSIEADDDAFNESTDAEEPAVEVTTTSVIEAVLFAADEPITPQKLAEITGAAGIKHWIETRYDIQIPKHDQRIVQIKNRIDAEYEANRVSAISDLEMFTWIKEVFSDELPSRRE